MSVGEIDSLLTFCFAVGVDRLVLAQLAPVGQARGHVADLALSDDELAEALAAANARSAELGITVGIGLPVEPCRIDRDRYPHLQFEACRCGQDKWVLEPSGAVRTCELADAVVGNLLDRSLVEISRSAAVAMFRRTPPKPECHDCNQWRVCQGGCRFRGRS
jgi:radical SAM protein with 4Fe4S-binding SPASM domain